MSNFWDTASLFKISSESGHRGNFCLLRRKKSYKKRKFQHIYNPTKRTTLHISLLIASADGLIECFFSSRRRTAFTNQQSWFIKTTIFFSLTNSNCSSIDIYRILNFYASILCNIPSQRLSCPALFLQSH